MPLDRLVLILVAVLAAAGLTIWVAVTVAASWSLGPGALAAALLPVTLLLYVLGRLAAQRLSSREDDRYDRIER